MKTDYSLKKLKAEIERENKCNILEFNDLYLVVKCSNKKIRYSLHNNELIKTIIFEEK